MEAYGFAWRALCGVVGVVGVAAAALVLPPEALVALGLLLVTGGLTAAVGYQSGDAAEPPRHTRKRAILFAAGGCMAVTAVIGLVAILGGSAIGLLLILGGASPPAIRWIGARLAPSRGPVEEGPVEVVHTTAELCRQWRDSYEALQQAVTPTARLRVVMARQRCLDELERRDPEGLRAWLSSSASAAGDPSRFLAHTDQTDSEPPAET